MDSFDKLYEAILHPYTSKSSGEGKGKRLKKNDPVSPTCGTDKRRGYNKKEWEDKPKQPSLDHDPGMWEGDDERP